MSGKKRCLFGERVMGDIARANAVSDECSGATGSEAEGRAKARLDHWGTPAPRSWFDRLTMSGKERRLFGERFMDDIATANGISDELLGWWGE